MKTYNIKGIDFLYDEALTYLDFYVDGEGGHIMEINVGGMLQSLQEGKADPTDLEYSMILLDRWIRDVPRKRFYRKMVLEGVSVLSGEHWFDDMSDREAEGIFTGLLNSACFAREFLRVYMPKVYEQCNQVKDGPLAGHPAEKYYIDP